LDATNQPEFPRFAQLLSNGVDDSISVGDFTGGFGQPESYSFNFPPGGDFVGSGFDITRFDVKITFTARQVGTGYDGLFGQTISVYGERQSAPVPEPASLSLLALGLVGLCGKALSAAEGVAQIGSRGQQPGHSSGGLAC